MRSDRTRRRTSIGRVALAAGLGLLLPAFAGAASVSPPTAVTGPVSEVGPASATVTGTVNPNGRATSWYVEYGTSTSYGSRTGAASAGSGTENVDVSSTLTGLASGTTYHYRLVAASDAGTGRGADGIFATSSAPGAVTGPTTAVAPTSATLGGTVDPNGRLTSWYFDYGTSTSYGSRTPARSAGSGTSPVSVSAAVSGLAPGRRYHYRLTATSDAGTSRGADQTFSTSSAPTAVTGPATDVAPTSATVTGSVDPKGQETTWYFEWGTSKAYGARTPARSAGSGTRSLPVSAGLTGLAAATTYHYRLVAGSASGTSVGGDRAFSTSFPPGARTGPAQVGAGAATLTGSVDPRGRSTAWYFEWGTSTSYGSRTPTASVGSRGGDHNVTAAISGLAPGATYHYRLVATSDAGTSRGADLTFTTFRPPSVVTAAATGVSGTSATLRGAVAAGGLATTWYFEYGTSEAYGLRTLAATAALDRASHPVEAAVSGLSPGVRYHYRLVATNAAGSAVGGDSIFSTVLLPRTPSGAFVRCTIVGTEGRDVLRGGRAKDVICGLGGDDRILGGGGSDVIYAGPGRDVVLAGAGNDAVFGGLGDDLVRGGAGRDALDGGFGRDRLFGGPGNDSLRARDGTRDHVDGGSGRDRARIDRGRDRLRSATAFS